MAPVAPIGRERAIALVRQGSLPVHLGSPHPNVLIVEQDGQFRIRELVVDQEEAARASSQRRRTPSWMPEHYYALGRPTGTIHAEAASAEALVAIMTTMTWPEHW